MKTRELVREVREAAKAAGKSFDLVRTTGPHDVYRCGATTVAVPRHKEIGPKMAFEIRKELEPELGERWWK